MQISIQQTIVNVASWLSSEQVKRTSWKALVWILILIAVAIFSLPLFWMVSTSLKDVKEVFKTPPQWIPFPPEWSNYSDLWSLAPWTLFFRNSLTISFSVVCGQVLSGSLVAFGFARLYSRGREFLFLLVLGTLMLVPQVTLIPLYVLFARLEWVNTFKPLIVPSFLGGNAFYIFLMRQYFLTIPRELDDAARIDGCGSFKIYYSIILPNSKAVLFSVVIFAFVTSWNDFLGPLIYLDDLEKWTVTLGVLALKYMAGAGSTSVICNWPVMMAGSFLAIIPALLVFISCQKYFVRGISLTGIK